MTDRRGAGDASGHRKGGSSLVLMLVHSLYRYDTRVKKQAEALVGAGHEVRVLALDDQAQLDGSDGVDVTGVGLEAQFLKRAAPSQFIRLWFRFLFKSALWLARQQVGQRARVVVVHNMPNFLVIAAAPWRLLGVRVVLDLHDSMEDVLRSRRSDAGTISRLAFRLEEGLSVYAATACLTVNRPIARHFNARTGRSFKVIHNAPPFRNESPLRRRFDGGEFRLAVHGHVHERYGIQRVLPVIASLRAEGLDFRLTVFGHGPYLASLESLAGELGLGGAVVFRGPFKSAELPELLANQHLGLALYPKSEFADRLLPVKVLEYVAVGLPFGSSDLAGVRAYFGDNEGLFFDQESELREVLLRARENYDSLLQRAVAAQQTTLAMAWESESAEYVKWVTNE